MPVLTVNNLKKTYSTRTGGGVDALKNITFTVDKGEYIAIMGESGSGKTTLLNIIATLDTQTGGEVLFNDINLSKINERTMSSFRRTNLGFVFQDFNLLDTFSVKDNILLPLVLAQTSYKDMEKRLLQVANKLGIEKLLSKYPYEISGGEKQRTAVARAIITRPQLILADEPTGALDSASAEKLLNILEKINDEGQTILMVTHSIKAASRAKRVLFIKDGVIFHQIYKGDISNSAMFEKISDTLTILERGV